MSTPDRAIERIARRQHGAFNIRQAKEAGFTNRMIERRVRSGAWRRAARGVYALAAVRRTWHQRLMEAVLSQPRAAICGKPACALHQLDGFGMCRPELVVPSNANHRCDLATIHRSDGVPLTSVAQIPVVTALQALFDISGTVSFRDLRRAAEDGVGRDLIDVNDLVDRVELLAPQLNHGIGDMRLLGRHLCDPTFVAPVTALERQMSEVLDEVGLPHGRQVGFAWRAPVPMTVDAVVPSLRLIAEADGRTWHGRHRAQHDDRKRDRVALINGYDTMRFTHTMLTHERAETVADLRAYVRIRREALALLLARAPDQPSAA